MLFKCSFALAVAAGCLLVSAASGQSTYSVTEIPNLPGINYPSTVVGLNNAGQVIGYHRWTTTVGRGGSRTHFLGWEYANGQISQIGPTNFAPVGINSSGEIAGNITLGSHPAVVQDGATTQLTTSIGLATDLDDDGNVVGYLGGGAAPYQAVEWSNGSETVLCPTAWMSTATAIGGGKVAGSVELNAGSGVWFFGGDVNNPDFIMTEDPFYDEVRSISSLGTAAGFEDIRIVGGATYTNAIVYNNGTLTYLDPLLSGNSWANSVNTSNVVVGAMGGHAIRWANGVGTDLNDLIPAGSGWTLTEAKGINDDGLIVGMGTLNGVARPFVLTPAEEVSGTIDLQNYSGDPRVIPVTVEIREPGSTSALETHVVFVDGNGGFAFSTSLPAGSYDIAAKASHWLRETLHDQTLRATGIAAISFSLANGDVNGDNSVSLGDFAQLRLAYGSMLGSPNWNPDADLDGNGAVGLSDFASFRQNYGRGGDR